MPSSVQIVPLITVWDYLLGDDGKPIVGAVVSLTLTYPQANFTNPIVGIEPVPVFSAPTDGNGYWQVSVPANVGNPPTITPLNTLYTVEVVGSQRRYQVSVSNIAVPGVGWQSSAIAVGVAPTISPVSPIVPSLTVTGLLTAGSLTVTGATSFGSLSASRLMLSTGPWIDPMHATYGGVGDGATDDAGAIQAAIDALPASGGVIDLRNAPSNAWKINTQLTNRGTKCVWLVGGGSGLQPGTGTRLNVAAGVSGINYLNGAAGNGARSGIQGLHLVGSDSAPGANDGILLQCNSGQLIDVVVEGFGGYGVNIDSSAADITHNANEWIGERIRVYNNFTGGWHTLGPNSNAGSAFMLDGTQNTGFGIYENSTLGNAYFGIHLSSNTGGGIRLGNTTRANQMHGVYYESQNAQALQIDAGGAGGNIVAFTNCSRIDGTNPITDNSAANNFIYLNWGGYHWTKALYGPSTGPQVLIDGATGTAAFLGGGQVQLQNAAVTVNWFMGPVSAGKLLPISSADAAAVLQFVIAAEKARIDTTGLSLDGGTTYVNLNAIDRSVNTHRFHFEPLNTTGINPVVVGTGTVLAFGGGRGHSLATGVTNPSSCSERILMNPSGGVLSLVSKVRRIEFNGYIADTYANSNAFWYVTDENVDTIPVATFRHLGIKQLNGVCSFTTADGTTEQATDITAFVAAATETGFVITFDGTTARCYVNGTLRATHATNVPGAGANSAVFRAFINNNNSANARTMAFYSADVVFANS